MDDNDPPGSELDTGTDNCAGSGSDARAGAGWAGGRVELAHVRAALGATAELLRVLSGLLWQAGGAELTDLLGELDQVAALAGAGRFAVTGEALQRGEIAASQCASTAAWVAQHAPSLAAGPGPGQLAKCVEALRRPSLQPVKDAVLAGQLPVPVALVVVSEFDKLRGRIIPEAEALVLNGLVRIGIEDGAREVRRLRTRLLAEHGAQDEFQDEQDNAARQVALSHPVQVDEGVWEYLLRVDAEAKAVLEAAIGPLSAPWHPPGAHDPRSAQQRRAQALIEVCRRVTAAAKAAGPFGGYPASNRAGSPATSAGPNTSAPSDHADPGDARTSPSDAREHPDEAARAETDERTQQAGPEHIGQDREYRDRADPEVEHVGWFEHAGWFDADRSDDRAERAGPDDGEDWQDGDRADTDPSGPGWADTGTSDDRTEQTGQDHRGEDSGQTDLPDASAYQSGQAGRAQGTDRTGQADTRASGFDADAIDPQTLRAALAGVGAGGAKATLMLTMSLTDLQHRVGAATTLGTTEDGTLLAPETARRIACNAGIIPVVLGSQGEVVDLGRTERLFSPAQARVVLLRDRHCSFTGCSIPGFWCHLHHVRHWLDGGLTDVANAALLCNRHHTIVHRDRLIATVTPTGVHWNTLLGSYDQALAHDRTPAA